MSGIGEKLGAATAEACNEIYRLRAALDEAERQREREQSRADHLARELRRESDLRAGAERGRDWWVDNANGLREKLVHQEEHHRAALADAERESQAAYEELEWENGGSARR